MEIDMIRDITIGQYYPSKSRIHALDARVKLIGTFLYLISLFLFENFSGFIFVFAFLIMNIFLSKVPVKFIFRGLRSVFVILLFTATLHLFWTPGKAVAEMGPVSITDAGIRYAVFMALRLFLLVIGSSLMTLTTTPNQLAAAFENVLKPLERFKVPVQDIAVMMSIALRFIPILLEELDKIMKAQMARGADFESGNLFQRAKSMIPIIVPLFISAIRRSEELALAMEVRCYNNGKGKTKMNPLRYKKADWIGYGIIFVYLIAVVVVPRSLPF